MLIQLLMAAIGGFCGTACRFLGEKLVKRFFPGGYPWPTLMVNVTGCYIIGLFFGLWGRHCFDLNVNMLLITGFCGGYTTFSSFSHDSYKLIVNGQWAKYIAYLLPTMALAVTMVYLGVMTITGSWAIPA